MGKPGYSPEGRQIVVAHKTFEQPSRTVVSINFANKQTWWFGSVRVAEAVSLSEELAPQGCVYPLSVEGPIINIYSFVEGDLLTSYYSPANYKVEVKKNGISLAGKEYGFEAGSTSENTTGSHPDAYKVDYANGRIVFDNPQEGHSIEVTYSRPDKATFKVSSPEGKRWRVHHVELQFGVDHTAWLSPLEFVMGTNLSTEESSDYDAVVFTYRSIDDILDKANLGTFVPACGDMTAGRYQIPFDYIAGFTVVPRGTAPNPSKNTVNYFGLRSKYDLPIPNTQKATASFYIFEENLEA